MVLPIKKTSIYAGLGSLSGVLKTEQNALEIEYQKMDDIFRIYKSDVETIRIELSDLEHIEVKKRWFSKYLCISVKNLRSVGKFPNVDGNCIRLKLKSEDVEKAKSLTSRFMLELSEHRLKELDSSANSTEHQSDEIIPDSTVYDDRGNRSERDSDGLKNILREKNDG